MGLRTARRRMARCLAGLVFLALPGGLFALGSRDAGVSAPVPDPAPPASPARQGPKIRAYFFYEEVCGLCHTDEERFIAILGEKLPLAERDKYPHLIEVLNIYEQGGRARYEELTGELGLDRGQLEPPLLILEGRVFQGYDSISANIQGAYHAAGEALLGEAGG